MSASEEHAARRRHPERSAPVPTQPADAPLNLLSLLRLLRAAGFTLFGQGALHGQLLQVEWAQEKQRLLQMLLSLLCGGACALLLLILLNVLLLALSWAPPYRLVTLLGLLLAHGLGCALAWRRWRSLAALAGSSFAGSREELAADLDLLKSRL